MVGLKHRALLWLFHWLHHPNKTVEQKNKTWLVVSTHRKDISQNVNLPQIGVKIKNIWNHHLITCWATIGILYIYYNYQNPDTFPMSFPYFFFVQSQKKHARLQAFREVCSSPKLHPFWSFCIPIFAKFMTSCWQRPHQWWGPTSSDFCCPNGIWIPVSKGLESPPFPSHEKPIWKGNTPT